MNIEETSGMWSIRYGKYFLNQLASFGVEPLGWSFQGEYCQAYIGSRCIHFLFNRMRDGSVVNLPSLPLDQAESRRLKRFWGDATTDLVFAYFHDTGDFTFVDAKRSKTYSFHPRHLEPSPLSPIPSHEEHFNLVVKRLSKQIAAKINLPFETYLLSGPHPTYLIGRNRDEVANLDICGVINVLVTDSRLEDPFAKLKREELEWILKWETAVGPKKALIAYTTSRYGASRRYILGEQTEMLWLEYDFEAARLSRLWDIEPRLEEMRNKPLFKTVDGCR